MISREVKEKFFKSFCILSIFTSLMVLIVLLGHILYEGLATLNWDFINQFPSRFPNKAGIKSALVGSLYVMVMTFFIAVPFGVATSIYLEEYAKKNGFNKIVQINIANLAGMPSIIYGLLGLSIFVRFLNFDQSLLSGSLTLSLLILPIIVIASQEALKAVPRSIHHAAYALGAKKWEVVFQQVLPAATPGILTGVILAMSRAIGESAPLIMIGALSYVAFLPDGPMDAFTVLPVQIYNWAGRPQADFHAIAASGIIVLLVVLFMLNGLAVYIRARAQRNQM